MSAFTDSLVAAAQAEHKRFLKADGSHGKEYEESVDKTKNYSKIVGEYWKSIHIVREGKTLDEKGNRPPWSAAFISFIVRKAGAGDKFLYAQAHRSYIAQAILAAEDSVAGTAYVAQRVESAVPKPGDLLAKGREQAKQFNYDKALKKAREKKDADQGYSSHCDVVIAADLSSRSVTSIGGNLSNSVMVKTWKTDKDGHLLPYEEKDSKGNISKYPWIAVLACRI